MADHNTHTKTGAREVFLRTIAIVGLIAVLVLGAWGIILLAFNLPSVFSNIGTSIHSAFVGDDTLPTGSENPALVVTAPQTVASGTAFQVAWDNQDINSGDYTYTLSYACESGLSLKAPVANGSYQTVSCNTPFNSVNATANMRLIPTVTGTASKTAAITVTATDASGNPVAFSSTEITVTAAAAQQPSAPATPSNNSNSSTYVPAATRATQLYGYADLSTRIISIQPTTQSYTTGQTRRYTMQFEIANVGTNVAGSGWNFNTLIPWTPNTYTFTSQAQQALYPGDKIVYTLGFDATSQSQVCTLQYPNNCQYQYQNPNYQYQTSTCGYRYNGYSNVWSCGYTDANGNWIETGAQNQNQNYNPYAANQAVTVNADPSNWIPESTDANNSATVSLPY